MRIFSGILILSLLASSGIAEPGSLDSIEARWRSRILELKDLEPAERVQQSTGFFSEFSWEEIDAYCSEEGALEESEHASTLFGLVQGKLRSDDEVALSLLARLLTRPTFHSSCLEALVKFIGSNSDSFSALDDSDLLADAFLKLADSGRMPLNVSRDLERGAASLGSSDSLMARMMRYGRSPEGLQAHQGIQMLASSRVEESPDSLLLTFEELYRDGRHPAVLRKGLGILARKSGASSFSFLEEVYLGTADEDLRNNALRSLSVSGDPRAWTLILEAYGDSVTGIVKNTRTLEGDQRKFFWNLWFCVRLCEPTMIEALRSRSPEAALAAELLDRASQFGLPAEREAIPEALEAWGKSQGTYWGARASRIVSQFRSHPDPRPK
ncbi:MAG: hypothetical protein QF492_05305 [Candidatus Krumholzibacteria bacterium]|jgi:hypothetical protein|nr:hypothetical protein [Candidatus Krumholzibacteria bacterium]MDP6669306.1 hypothetical protein [Candidatus Krumholzibacteria bacterium]MDP6796889.1 hypothetical protein [Candidatus Krumholzibacteria bacterium]MDP7021529.1 hypothetical protein [Candidatus Krumholzibacteria bacterium]